MYVVSAPVCVTLVSKDLLPVLDSACDSSGQCLVQQLCHSQVCVYSVCVFLYLCVCAVPAL